MTAQEMIDSGGKAILRIGVQGRPLIKFNEKLYEKAIHFDDGYCHDEMYEVSGQRALKLLEWAINK